MHGSGRGRAATSRQQQPTARTGPGVVAQTAVLAIRSGAAAQGQRPPGDLVGGPGLGLAAGQVGVPPSQPWSHPSPTAALPPSDPAAGGSAAVARSSPEPVRARPAGRSMPSRRHPSCGPARCACAGIEQLSRSSRSASPSPPARCSRRSLTWRFRADRPCGAARSALGGEAVAVPSWRCHRW
jgi:hypothetical protein